MIKSPDFDKVLGVTEMEICEEENDNEKKLKRRKKKVSEGIIFIGVWCFFC